MSNSETAKYLHKVAGFVSQVKICFVGENLIFLFSSIYFTVGFGRHIQF